MLPQRSHLWGLVDARNRCSYRTSLGKGEEKGKREGRHWNIHAQNSVSSAVLSSTKGRATWPWLKGSTLWRFWGETNNERHAGVISKNPECFPFLSCRGVLKCRLASSVDCEWVLRTIKILVVSWIRPVSVCLDNSGLERLPLRKPGDRSAKAAHLGGAACAVALKGFAADDRNLTNRGELQLVSYKKKCHSQHFQLLTDGNCSFDFTQWLFWDDTQVWSLEFELHTTPWSL